MEPKKPSNYKYPPSFSLAEKLMKLPRVANYPIEVMHENFETVGDSYFIEIFLNEFKMIFTRDPGFAEYILQKNHRNYHKSPIQSERLSKYVGKGLLTSNGDFWLRQRRLIQPGFSKSRINTLTAMFQEEVEKFVQSVPKNETLDLHALTSRFAFDIIAKSLFSKELNQEKFDEFRYRTEKVQEMFTKEMRKPQWLWKYRLFGDIKRHLAMSQETKGFLKEIIAERRASGESQEDLLDMMLHVRYEDTGEPMEDGQLIDEILILFIAGQETTASALAWTFYLLDQNPKEKSKLIEYLNGQSFEKGDYQSILADKGTFNAIQETLRLYPPAWIVDRETLKDDAYGDFSFPAETQVAISIYELHRHKDLWKNPEAFMPDRFIENPNPKHYLPFGAGPRLCIGNHFAILEMMTLIQGILKHLNYEIVEPEKVRAKALVTLHPENLNIRFSGK